MISDESWDSEDCSNDAAITGINDILKYIKIIIAKNSYVIMFHNITIFTKYFIKNMRKSFRSQSSTYVW